MKFQKQLFAQSIRNHRKPRTLRDVSDETGISAATHYRIEQGGKPDMDTFCRLCTWMNRNPSIFFTSQEKKDK